MNCWLICVIGNAFGSSASLFDALSEIDSKFAKIADKECDAVTGEVRKWFKKLAVRALLLFDACLAHSRVVEGGEVS